MRWVFQGISALILSESLCSWFAWLSDQAFSQVSGQTPAATASRNPRQRPRLQLHRLPRMKARKLADFQVTQSIEIGGRISDVSGSQPMYDTLVNYQSGARILEQSLTMQSLTHAGLLRHADAQ